ncbi:hypothetical protein Tco_1440320 [Tanacetum coccineum]
METKDVHAIKYKMSKAKERCMAYFRSFHSCLQVLSKEDLKGTRIEHGFKRAFMSLFGQDDDTFTSTMLLNVDQLQKQLDKDEFQEDGTMAAFCVINRQFQKFIDSQFTLDYNNTSRKSGNDADVDNADIKPVYDEEPMAEVQYTVECNIFAKGQQHTKQPEIINECRVDHSKPRFASQVDVKNNLSKLVTQHYFPKGIASAFAKPDHVIAFSESRNSSKNMPRFSLNGMIHNHYQEEVKKKTEEKDRNSKSSGMPSTSLQNTTNGSKSKPRRNNETTRSLPVSKSSYATSNVVPLSVVAKKADISETSVKVDSKLISTMSTKVLTTDMIESECLFGPLFDEYFNKVNQVVSKSFVVTTADASDKHQQQPDSTSSTSTLEKTVTVVGNFNVYIFLFFSLF